MINDPRKAHQKHADEILATLDRIRPAIVERQQEADSPAVNIHWGHVGDMAHYNDMLAEVEAERPRCGRTASLLVAL